MKTIITRYKKGGTVIEVLPFKSKKEAIAWMKSFYYQENFYGTKRVGINPSFTSATVEYDGIEERYIVGKPTKK